MERTTNGGWQLLFKLLILASCFTATPARTEGAGPKLWVIPAEPYFGNVDPEPDEVQDSIALYQPYFDQFSWMNFIAINWPATVDGKADEGKWIGADSDATTVWEHWMNADDIFRGPGKKEAPWGRMFLPQKCDQVSPDSDGTIASGKYLIFTAEDDSQSAHNVPTTDALHNRRSGPLVDQSGVWARFETYVNETSYRYIVDKKLHTAEGQQAFFESGQRIQFPPGSMEIKVVWKVLDDNEAKQILSPYHRRTALFFSKEKPCRTSQVGMVAMHILVRTARMPNGVWATFDNISNLCTLVPADPKSNATSPDTDGGAPPANVWKSGGFCSANCMNKPWAEGCAPNQPLKTDWRPSADPLNPRDRTPTQVTRVRPIPMGSGQATAIFKYLFQQTSKYSVWKNYQLIGTQWVLGLNSDNNTASDRGGNIAPGDGLAPQYALSMNPALENNCNGAPCPPQNSPGLVVPAMLGNPMIETYGQKGSSCFGCHQTAKTSLGQFSDFSWLLARVSGNAKK